MPWPTLVPDSSSLLSDFLQDNDASVRTKRALRGLHVTALRFRVGRFGRALALNNLMKIHRIGGL